MMHRRLPTNRRLTLAQARRIAITAQGLDRARPETVSMRQVVSTIKRIGLLQIDSVNVLARAHLLPLFARLGPYDTALVERATGKAPRKIVETWAHEASYVPATTFPLLAWNRRRWPGMNRAGLEAEYPGLLDTVCRIVAENGPVTSREIEAFLESNHTERPRHQWGWAWSPAKLAVEILFDDGALTPAGRSTQFERLYDLTERVLPPGIRSQPPVDQDAATLELVRIAVRAHGIGSIRCFADYFRLKQSETRRAVNVLAAAGELVPVKVTGWDRALWMHADVRVPRRVQARALLAPFDPLVFERRRLLEVFGMHYRLEIYTPADQRVYGYYVLPFLLGEHLVARVDLKHDRARGALMIRSAYAEAPEPDAAAGGTWPDRSVISHELRTEVQIMAGWLGVSHVGVDDDAHGDLISHLTI